MMKRAKEARLADLAAQKELSKEEIEEQEDLKAEYGKKYAGKENDEPRVVEIEDDEGPPELEKVDIDAEREELKKKQEWSARVEKQKAERE